MTRALLYPGADRSSRWYQSTISTLAQPEVTKLVLHSTETPGSGGCPGYSGGTAAPTVTVNPWPGREEVWQHFNANASAKALVDPGSTAVRENRDNVAQIEIIGYSQESLGSKWWLGNLPQSGIDYIARIIAWYHEEWGLPLVLTPLKWSIAKNNPGDPRYTGSQYDKFEGILAHRHVSGNQHWDVSIDAPALLAAAKKIVSPVAPAAPVAPQPEKSLIMSLAEDKAALLAVLKDPDVKAALGVAAQSVTYGDHDGDGKRDTVGQIVSMTSREVRSLRVEQAALRALVTQQGPVTDADIDQLAAEISSRLAAQISIDVKASK